MPDDFPNLEFNPFSSAESSLNGFHEPMTATTSNTPKRQSSFDSSTASSSSSSGLSIFTGRALHSRARTEVDNTAAPYQHPLRNAGPSNGFADSGVTRPHLNRVLTTKLIDLGEETQRDEETREVENADEEEQMVLVHRVTGKDSLAGVALKYGITITELRRANQLWSSDSIHLRKELFIPIDKASRRPSDNSVPSPSSPLRRDQLVDDSVPEKPPPPTIRNIPTKTLSFFPPPAKPAVAPSSVARTSLELPNDHSRTTATTTMPFNTFLAALPITASTRDSIMARLSFDSATSSYSDDHELDEVRVQRHVRSLSHDDAIEAFNNTSSTRKPPRTGILRKTHGKPPSSAIHMQDLPRQNSPPTPVSAAYPMSSPNNISTSPDITSFPVPIRTVQMEPSPTMHLPSLRKEIRSNTLGSNFDTRRSNRRPILNGVFGSKGETDGTSTSGNG